MPRRLVFPYLRKACVAFLFLCLARIASAAAEQPILITRIPAAAASEAFAHSGQSRSGALCKTRAWLEHAEIVLLETNGSIRALTTEFAAASDPNVSFDGATMLFAGRKPGEAHWRIWEMSLNDGRSRMVTPDGLDAHSPIYVSALFTLDSPQPWFTTVFVAHELVPGESGAQCSSSLYNIKLDGTELRRLTFNPNHNRDPHQMWDGRVIYSAERTAGAPGVPSSQTRAQLRAIHIEGADMELYGGEKCGPTQLMPAAIGRQLTAFIEPYTNSPDGAGALMCVQQRRPHVTGETIAGVSSGFAWLYPAPYDEEFILVARRPLMGGTFGIFQVNSASLMETVPVLDSPDFHEIQAVTVAPRNRPDGHSTVVNTRKESGRFYGLNCYDTGGYLSGQIPPGTVHRVRFLEGIPEQRGQTNFSSAGKGSGIIRRLVGEAPVEQDGSFNVEVPADIPLLLQAVDKQGMAVATTGWIWVKPDESRGCIGCHEDPERIPENVYVQALKRPSTMLVLPPEKRRTISFAEDIAPLLQNHCATAHCHTGGDAPLKLKFNDKPSAAQLEELYALLTSSSPDAAGSEKPARPGYITPGQARTSPLVWQLTGTNTSKPWDKATFGTPFSGHLLSEHAKALNSEQIRTLFQWIDLGAPYRAPATRSTVP